MLKWDWDGGGSILSGREILCRWLRKHWMTAVLQKYGKILCFRLCLIKFIHPTAVSLDLRTEAGAKLGWESKNELFSATEMAAIKNTPIRAQPCGDRWIWQHTSKSNFSEKYAQHIQVSNSVLMSTSSSSLIGVSDSTWNLFWRALHNKLPAAKNFV